MKDISIYDNDLRNGASVLDVSYQAECTPQTVYKFMRKHGIKIGKQGRPLTPKRLMVDAEKFTKEGRLNYWPWLKDEIARLGVDEVKRRYGG